MELKVVEEVKEEEGKYSFHLPPANSATLHLETMMMMMMMTMMMTTVSTVTMTSSSWTSRCPT
jgi:RNA 3'-terminal phosphate cyclase